MPNPVVERMRDRARQLRRMADLAHDPRVIDAMIKMAAEVEADAERLEREASWEAEAGKRPGGK